MFKFLFKDVTTRKMLVNFRELTSYLMKEAGMDDELPGLVDKIAFIKMIAGMFFIHPSDAYRDFCYLLSIFLVSSPKKIVWFSNLPIYFFILFFCILFFLLYRIWSKKVLTRKLELIPFAERAIASLKVAGRDDLEEDIEDAEFLIEDYKDRFGF